MRGDVSARSGCHLKLPIPAAGKLINKVLESISIMAAPYTSVCVPSNGPIGVYERRSSTTARPVTPSQSSSKEWRYLAQAGGRS